MKSKRTKLRKAIGRRGGDWADETEEGKIYKERRRKKKRIKQT